LALRVGYNTQSDVHQFSAGAGFAFMRMNLDYSFGMVANSNINSLHQVTFSFRFDDARNAPPRAVVRARELTNRQATQPTAQEKWLLDVTKAKQKALAVEEEQEIAAESKQEVSKYKTALPLEKSTYQVYEVKPGETLQSITKSRYGSAVDWQDVYSVNRHLYGSPDDIKPGSRILLPVKKGS